jgi:uroporphyrinogen decarboxylase
MQKMTDGQLAPPIGTIAGIDIAALMFGFDNICLAMKLYPEATHTYFSKLNQFLINYIELRIELYGVKSMPIVDLYGDFAAYLSEADFREFVLPYNKQIYDYFSEEDSVRLYHTDGPCRHLKQGLVDMGVTCLYNFDPETDLAEYVEEIGDRVCLIGNMHPVPIIRNGTEEDVYNEAKRLIEVGKKAKGFVLGLGGELPNGTPPENIDALLRALDDFGAY